MSSLLPAGATRHQIDLPSVQLSYLEWHPGGEPLLLLHGLADHGMVWSKLAEESSDRFHCVAPDLRGHGDSGKPPSGYSCQDIVADLEALMQHLGWSSAHVVSHSWSSKLALTWATAKPDRFRSLVLVDPFFVNQMPGWVRFTFPFFYRVLPFLKVMRSFDTYEAASQLAQQLKQYRGWSPLQEAVFQASMEQKENGTWSSKFVAQARDEVFEDMVRVSGLTRAIDLPTLLVLPTEGLNRAAFQINPYKTFLKNLQIASVPGNHWCFLVEPEAFNQRIVSFLNSVL